MFIGLWPLFSRLYRNPFSSITATAGISTMSIPHYFNGLYHIPKPSGKYAVGCTDIMVGPDVENGCFLRLYFPSSMEMNIYDHSSKWAKWIPHPKYIEGYASVMAGLYPFISNKIMSWMFGNFWIPALCDAEPLASAAHKFPVVVFSHGLTGCRTSYSMICTELSSHGFVVAALEHRDKSACMSFSLDSTDHNGKSIEKWIPYQNWNFEKEDMQMRQTQLGIRIRESQRALDLLTRLNDGQSLESVLMKKIDLVKFKGLMDLSSPVIAGHSFGSATLLRTLAVEKRFRVGVALDAWLWPLKDDSKVIPKDIDQPILFINMEAFQNASNLNAMKRFTTNADFTERRVVTLRGSVHKNQVDLPFILPWYMRRFGGVNSAIDPEVAMKLNNCIMLSFIWKHIGYPIKEELLNYVEEHRELLLEGIP